MRHTYTCQLRWADMDALGHVNNVVYADYLQEARVDMLRVHARGPSTGQLADALVVVSNRLQYLAPLVYDGRPVQIECWVTDLRAATATLAYEIFRPSTGSGNADSGNADSGNATPGERTVYLRATTVLTPYVFAEERPRRFTAEERAGLAAYLEEPAAGMREPTPYGTDPGSARTEDGHYPVQVRFSDVDVYGHVNNVQYFEFFQEARILLTRRLMERTAPGTASPSVVVAQQDIEYKRPMLLRPEPYDSWTWITHLGRTSMVLEAEIRDASAGCTDGPTGEVMARGRFVLVFFDPASGRPTEPSPQVRAAVSVD